MIQDNTTARTYSNCYNTGAVTSWFNDGAGGIIGYVNNSYRTVSYCYNTGEVMANSKGGGIIGINKAVKSVSNCFYSGRVNLINTVNTVTQKGTETDDDTIKNLINQTTWKDFLKQDYEGETSINKGFPIFNWQ